MEKTAKKAGQGQRKIWWKEAVVYQIYPRSFCDSNGDGIGDIGGIISKLKYLKLLGVDVLWLSPVYASPNDDNGYDISDYQAIMKDFGTMDDFDELLERSHELGMKIIMDLVVNHTSDEHAWFVESKKGGDNPYRDYYIWKNGRTDGSVPNNWGSVFGGSAWEFDRESGMYYLHLFSKKQPDLNWENPAVRNEVFEMMDWWCKKGIDGFRMDVISLISKDPAFPDGIAGKDGYGDFSPYAVTGPRVHEYLKEMNHRVLSRYDLLTVGEAFGVTLEEARDYAGEDRNELNMIFQFEHVAAEGEFGKWNDQKPELTHLQSIFTKWQKGLAGHSWNSLFLDNHDQPRAVSQFGDARETYRVLSAKMLATCLHMMQGTPFIYQGEELGMTNFPFTDVTQLRDLESINAYEHLVGTGQVSHEKMMDYLRCKGRDNARTPMQWDHGVQAGFTTGTPWIEINPNYLFINARQQMQDTSSVFQYYQTLIRLRKQNEIIIYGEYDEWMPENPAVFSFLRKLGAETLLVLCNYTENRQVVEFPEDFYPERGRILIGNYPDPPEPIKAGELRAYEAIVYRYCHNEPLFQ